MQKKIENITGVCEMCGSLNEPEDIYVDTFNEIWTMECPRCFYSRNENDVDGYLDRALKTNAMILSEKEFNKVRKAMIVIGNAYPYLKEGGDFTAEEKYNMFSHAVNRFVKSKKFVRKFILVNLQSKVQEQQIPQGDAIVVAVRAYVKFQNYLEYIEHEMYLQFRKDCASTFESIN